MAAIAMRDQENREVMVNREQLLKQLRDNLIDHVEAYQEAMEGYRFELSKRVDQAFEDAKKKLDRKHEEVKNRIANLTDEDIPKQTDHQTLIDSIQFHMRVPRCYKSEYESAIDMVRWDTREVLELSYAEFQCFVRDEWDWKSDFDVISKSYSGIAPKTMKNR